MVHALIIGAGIAGPVTAMALQRVGVTSTIFEAHGPADPDAGSYLTMTANGLDALRAVGALEACLGIAFPTRRNVLWNDAGRRLATLSLGSRLPGSPLAHTMKRSRLARVLQDEAVRRGIPLEHHRRLADATISPEGRAMATFEDGTTAEGDVLIGADGVRSAVRRIIDPAAPAARYVGLSNFGGVTRGGAIGGHAERAIEPEAWHLVFGRRAFFGYQARPDGDVVWFANVPGPAITPEGRASTSQATWRARLAELYEGDARPAIELIEAGHLELAADNTHDLGHVLTWQRGPFVIIGDAAHAPAPSSGQGASMACEDAIVLASAVRDARSIGEAFAAYERSRRERVERIVAWGARGSSSKMPGAFGRMARDLILGLLFRYVVTERSLGWMYDYRAA